MNIVIQKMLIEDFWKIPENISAKILEKYYLIKWDNIYLFSRKLKRDSHGNTILTHHGINYRVKFTNPKVNKKYYWLSFRKPHNNFIKPIVLIKSGLDNHDRI